MDALPLVAFAAAVVFHGPPQLELGQTLNAVRAGYGKELRPEDPEGFSLSSVRDDGVTYHDVFLKFGNTDHRLVRFELALEGRRVCDRLETRMYLRYGEPIEQDMISQHVWVLWKLKGRLGYTAYTAYLDPHNGATCWKRYQLGRGD